MTSPVSAAIVACAILGPGHHIPLENRAEIARVEAESFLANVQPHIGLELLLGVAWTESRFSPTGSARDRANHVYGILQIRCDHDCDSYLDPATNIRRGASLLALRYRQVHSARQRPRVLASWTGAYFWGSVPLSRRRSVVRAWYRYAGRVRAAQQMMGARIARCQQEF